MYDAALRKEAIGEDEGAVLASSLAPVQALRPRLRRPLKILLYGINFAPEPTGIGRYTGEMAEWLARAGHDVRVVTALPYYPAWRISSEYRDKNYLKEKWNGVTVYRVPLWVPRNPGGAKRVVHLGSYALTSLPLLARMALWRPHVVWCAAPALASAPAAAMMAKMCGAVSWLHVQDFEIDAAFNLGMLKSGPARKFALAGERAVMRGFDRVSSISQRMVDRLHVKGVKPEKTVFFPNWVDTEALRPVPRSTEFRRSLGIPDDAFVALYSGTMGAKQGLETLAETARRLSDARDIHFIFCGEGKGREGLHGGASGLPRVHWLPLQPAERLPELLGTADLHLLPQQQGAADLVLPSKLTGMLASGRPVLATADAGTELASWVEGCGAVVPPGDTIALAAKLQELAENREVCEQLGKRARDRSVERLSRDCVLARFQEQLENVLAERRARLFRPERRSSNGVPYIGVERRRRGAPVLIASPVGSEELERGR